MESRRTTADSNPGDRAIPVGGRRRQPAPFEETFEKELNVQITVHEGGKARKITKFLAIVKQQTNKAIQGDSKAAALVMKVLQSRQSDPKGTLSPLLGEMRAMNRKHELGSPNGARTTGASDLPDNLANDRVDPDHA